MTTSIRIMKSLLKSVPGVKRLANIYNSYVSLSDRVAYLERRLNNHRWFAIEEMVGYLVGAELPGDYCEFGVYKGDTFGHCLRSASVALPAMRFFAFDSFQGLPKPKDIDAADDFTSNFHEGEFACSRELFLNNLKTYHPDLSRVYPVPGWFSTSLTPETAMNIGLKYIAAAWIDCDLYESTIPVLDFITDKLSIGSIILFDDWHVYRNLPDRGQQRACTEWLVRNPTISLTPLFSFAHHGEAFTIRSL